MSEMKNSMYGYEEPDEDYEPDIDILTSLNNTKSNTLTINGKKHVLVDPSHIEALDAEVRLLMKKTKRLEMKVTNLFRSVEILERNIRLQDNKPDYSKRWST